METFQEFLDAQSLSLHYQERTKRKDLLRWLAFVPGLLIIQEDDVGSHDFGNGTTPEEARADFAKKIAGHTLRRQDAHFSAPASFAPEPTPLARSARDARALADRLMGPERERCRFAGKGERCMDSERVRGKKNRHVPFSAYNHREMCDPCAVFWHATMAANVLGVMEAQDRGVE